MALGYHIMIFHSFFLELLGVHVQTWKGLVDELSDWVN